MSTSTAGTPYDLTGDRSRHAEGRVDEAKGDLKGKFEEVKNDIKDKFRK